MALRATHEPEASAPTRQARRGIRHIAKPATLAAVLLGGALAVPASPPAFADSHDYRFVSIEEGFENASRTLLREIGGSGCYVPTTGGRVKLAFVGIPEKNVHFNNALRDKLNKIARKSIGQVALHVNVVTPRSFGTIAYLNPGNPAQLREAIKKIRSAPLTYVITAERPKKHIAQLKFEMFAQTDEGVQLCPKTEEVFVDIDKNRIVPEDRIPTSGQKRPVIEQGWAFKHALREAALAIRSFPSVVVDIDYQMSGSCSIQDNSSNAFASDYFEVGREQSGLSNIGDNSWPALEEPDGAPSEKSAVLNLEFVPDRKHRDLLNLTLKVSSGRRTRLVKYMRVLVDPADLEGCRSLSRDFLTRLMQQSRSTPAAFTLRPSKAKYVAKRDNVSIQIKLSEPRHLYCWIVAGDQSAYVLLPWSKDQASQPWRAGETISYPESFQTRKVGEEVLAGSVVYQRPARELFGCFGSAKRLPAEIESKWIEMQGSL